MIKNFYTKTKILLKKLIPGIKLIPETPEVDFSTSQEYQITKQILWQSIDFSQCNHYLSHYAQNLLQYFLGAFNHWGLETTYKSYRELREELLMSRYGIDKGIEELTHLGLLNRSCYGHKNKSHWTISLRQFLALKLKTFSAKVNQLIDRFLNKFKGSANSYSRRDLNINKLDHRLEIIARAKEIEDFKVLKQRIQRDPNQNIIQTCSNYMLKWRSKMEESYNDYQNFRGTKDFYREVKPNYGNKFEKRVSIGEDLSQVEKQKRCDDGIFRQSEANRTYIDKDPYGTFHQASKIAQEVPKEAPVALSCLDLMRQALGMRTRVVL